MGASAQVWVCNSTNQTLYNIAWDNNGTSWPASIAPNEVLFFAASSKWTDLVGMGTYSPTNAQDAEPSVTLNYNISATNSDASSASTSTTGNAFDPHNTNPSGSDQGSNVTVAFFIFDKA